LPSATAIATGPARDAQLEQLPLYEQAACAAAPHDQELALSLHARRLEVLLLARDAARFDAAAERFRDLAGDTPGECALLALLARKVMTDGGTAAGIAALVERAAGGELELARADLEEALGRLRSYGSGGVIGLDVRLDLALVLHALGDDAAAHARANEALAAASTWGAERARGGALRVSGVMRGEVERLREAVEVLGASPARLWEARAHVDLGATPRRANHRRESRPALRRGLELAEACGAAPLAQLARRELAAGGGRVPPRVGGGVAEPTPSELRVVELAASGLSNRQIAQRLFVTIKTIDMHLFNGYRKPGVHRRAELAATLR
jgi:DNA-binding CsgD family transcriptional regulator